MNQTKKPKASTKTSKKTSGLMKEVSSIFEKGKGTREPVPSLFKRTRVRFPVRWFTKRQVSSILEVLSLPVTGISRTITGLDIGKGAIKIVQMKKGLRGTKLVNITRIEIPSGMVGSERKEFIEKNLSRIVNQPNFKKGTVVSSIDDSQMVMRVVSIPAAVTHERLEATIRQKLEKQFNIDLTDRIVNYVKIGERTEKGIIQSVILVATVPKAVIDERQSFLRHFGFRYMVIEPGAFALARLFQEKEETAAILDIGEDVTSLNIVSGGTLQFSRYMHITGSVLTKAIEEKLNTDYKRADDLKKSCGLAEEENEEVYEALSFLVTRLARDVRLSLAYYIREAAMPAQKRIDRLVLCGGGSKLKNLPSFLSENIGMPVELISSLPSAISPEMHSYFATSTGLVLWKRGSGINFVPARATVISDLKGLPFKLVIPVPASIVLFLCILTHSQYSSRVRTCRDELKERKKVLQITKVKMSELEKRRELLFQEIAGESEKIKTEEENLLSLEDVIDNRTVWRDSMVELSRILPEDVWIKELSTNKGSLRIKAVSINSNLVSQFMEKLKSSEFFFGVEFCRSERQELSGQKIINFEVVCRTNKNAGLIE